MNTITHTIAKTEVRQIEVPQYFQSGFDFVRSEGNCKFTIIRELNTLKQTYIISNDDGNSIDVQEITEITEAEWKLKFAETVAKIGGFELIGEEAVAA